MNRFKLRPDLTFTPDGQRYLVCDETTRSTFRVGELEYQILKQFEEKSNLDEVRYLFRAQHGREVPFDTLKKFIHKAISLNLIEAESDSMWSRLAPSTAFTLKIKLFDPNRILDFLLRKLKPVFNSYGVIAAGAFLLAAAVVLAFNLTTIFSFARFKSPGYIGLSIGAMVVFAIGHELAHGLIGKRFGFDVSAVGFHLHYFMPSFFCRIFLRRQPPLVDPRLARRFHVRFDSDQSPARVVADITLECRAADLDQRRSDRDSGQGIPNPVESTVALF